MTDNANCLCSRVPVPEVRVRTFSITRYGQSANTLTHAGRTHVNGASASSFLAYGIFSVRTFERVHLRSGGAGEDDAPVYTKTTIRCSLIIISVKTDDLVRLFVSLVSHVCTESVPVSCSC